MRFYLILFLQTFSILSINQGRFESTEKPNQGPSRTQNIKREIVNYGGISTPGTVSLNHLEGFEAEVQDYFVIK